MSREEPQWVKVQKRAFLRWTNLQLRRARCQIDDLETGFKTGVALCRLCECISGERLRKINKKPKMEIHMLENLNIAVKWLKTKVDLVGIGSRGLYEGETKQTLGLLWTLILRFQVQDVEIDGVSGKKGLLLWCRRNIKDVDDSLPVRNFDNSWKDGLALSALISKFRPDLVDYEAAKAMGSDEERVARAFQVAKDSLEIPPLLEVEDLCGGKPDEKVVLMYISEFFKVFSTMVKAGAMIKGIRTAVDVTMRHDKYIEDYKEGSTDIAGWIEGKKFDMGSEADVGANEGDVKSKMEQFYQYCAQEKLERRGQLYGLKGSLAALHNSQSHNKRPAFQPESGLTVEELESSFAELVNMESAYEDRLSDTYKLFRKYRLLFQKLEARALQINDWAADKRNAMTKQDDKLSTISTLRPRVQIVVLTEERDFLKKFSFEMNNYAPVIAEMQAISDKIQAPSELEPRAKDLVADANEVQDEFVEVLKHRLDACENRLKKAAEMKDAFFDFIQLGDLYLFEMVGMTETVREPCLDDSVEQLEKHLAKIGKEHATNVQTQENRLAELEAAAGQLTEAGFGEVLAASPNNVQLFAEKLGGLVAAGKEALENLENDLNDEKKREEARKRFANAANSLRRSLDEHTAAVSMKEHRDKSLLDQNIVLAELRENYAAEEENLDQLKDLHMECEGLGIVTNDYTKETYHSLVSLHGELGKAFDRVAADIQAGLDADQKLSPEQLQELRKMFNSFDEKKTGSLEPEEFHAATTAMGIVITKEDLKKLFKKMDTDQNGHIGFDEFLKFMEDELLHSSTKSDVLEAFAALSGGDKKEVTKKQISENFQLPYLKFLMDGLQMTEDTPDDGKGNYSTFTNALFSR
eukprot:g2340.t1